MADVFWWFPGQGTQKLGMGRALAERSTVAAALFDEMREALGFDLTAIMWGDDEAELTATQNAQPAIVAVAVACLRVWLSRNPEHDTSVWAAGHSIGAIAAAIASEHLTFVEGIRLARRRGEIMAEAPGTGGMLAVIVRSEETRAQCDAAAADLGVDIAARNGNHQIVLSGDKALLEQARGMIDARTVPLTVSHGFHSRLMTPVQPAWDEIIAATTFTDSTIGFVGSATGELTLSGAAVADDLRLGLCHPVRWDKVISQATSASAGFVFGPGKALINFWKPRPPEITIDLIDEAALVAQGDN
ncbi:MAG: ACP S-malonyltransferase [Propionibacteriaceae bacterium]|jgi:[acyl-carrier-protein] S-malonyltransferase|nr:ACP S-malonyltransferase [Propionibacteriaceae bacterium]